MLSNPPPLYESDDDNSTIPYFGESRDKVHRGGDKVDDGTNGDNVNEQKPTEEQKNACINLCSNVRNQNWILLRGPIQLDTSSYTNDEDIYRAVFGDTDERVQVCVICYTLCPCEVNSA